MGSRKNFFRSLKLNNDFSRQHLTSPRNEVINAEASGNMIYGDGKKPLFPTSPNRMLYKGRDRVSFLNA